MRINRQLNLVIPIEQNDGTTIYVHAMPISYEVFEQHFLLISKTFAAIYAEGLGEIAGPRVAALLMRRVADQHKMDVENTLFAEMRRLSNVVLPTGKGWETLPLHDALSRQLLTSEDRMEVENAITFFCVSWSMHRRSDREMFLEGAAALWGAQLTSSNCMEFAGSLPTSTATASTGATAPPSSIPS